MNGRARGTIRRKRIKLCGLGCCCCWRRIEFSRRWNSVPPSLCVYFGYPSKQSSNWSTQTCESLVHNRPLFNVLLRPERVYATMMHRLIEYPRVDTLSTNLFANQNIHSFQWKNDNGLRYSLVWFHRPIDSDWLTVGLVRLKDSRSMQKRSNLLICKQILFKMKGFYFTTICCTPWRHNFGAGNRNGLGPCQTRAKATQRTDSSTNQRGSTHSLQRKHIVAQRMTNGFPAGPRGDVIGECLLIMTKPGVGQVRVGLGVGARRTIMTMIDCAHAGDAQRCTHACALNNCSLLNDGEPVGKQTNRHQAS